MAPPELLFQVKTGPFQGPKKAQIPGQKQALKKSIQIDFKV
jgi:hypothetical protein